MNFKTIIIITINLLFTYVNSNAQISEEQLEKFTEVITNISKYYTDDISGEKIVEKAIVATLKQLDPHSTYFSKEEVIEINKGLQGSFEGVGISYYIISDTIFITSTVSDGPSEIAGVRAGDRLMKVNKKDVAGVKITHKEIKKLLSGKKGSEVEFYVKRRGKKKIKKFKVVRDKIPVFSIKSAYMVTDKVAYIRLKRFSATSLSEFKKALKELKLSGAEHLIFDLRDNGGGYLRTAVNICDQFLRANEMIVYTEGANNPMKKYTSSISGIFTEGRLVLLVNEESASASEIVSGFVQDWDRGVIVGRRTYGKGLVQRPFTLNDGSVMRLTTAHYYTPSGRCIQKPYKAGDSEYFNDIKNRYKSGELVSEDSIKFADSLKYTTKIKNRTIYGGGGIMPDVFVPWDTLKYPEFYQNWLSGNLLFYFVNLYVDENREYFETIYSDFDFFEKNYKPDNNMCFALLKYISENKKNKLESVENVSIEDIVSNKNIRTHLKALIADSMWDDNEYYRIMNANSKTFNKALEIISDKDKYDEILK